MGSILDTIIADKKNEVAYLKKNRVMFSEWTGQPEKRSFVRTLSHSPELAIIAEVKKASPSKGVIRSDFNPVAIAEKYEAAGTDALSVLTDKKYFMGHVEYLIAIRKAVTKPVLRKDFIIDIIQVEETAAMGADALLLIVAALDDCQLVDLYQAAREMNVEVLVEIHDHRELDRAMRLSPECIGINNRNLSTFVTDISITLELVPHIPKQIVIVSESGIETGEQAQRVKTAGARALLVGESLVRQDDPKELLSSLKV